ncbi:IgGFc-binding protein [Chondromyces crocatus]|uniref:IgGFc-binding protein n=1 Tax=Chondromyces crocatus TaxID=52 RepID=UPI0012E0D76F|nr:IgGFc-binding protein [Chondromyces crocatus]
MKTAINAPGACFAAFVANTWDRPVKISVERNGIQYNAANFAYIPVVQGQSVDYEPYDDAAGLDVGQVAILFLSRNNSGGPVAPPCPRTPAVSAETGVNTTGMGNAFRIETDYPVVAYQLVPFGGGQTNVTGASLLLPTSAWDTNYITINGFASSEPEVQNGNPSLTVVASRDGTEVNLLPGVNVVGGNGIPATVAGTMATYSLDKGRFLQITQPEELTGSPISSNHPVGVWGAHSCMMVPNTGVADCDSSQQQLAPVRALGSEYAPAPYVKRGANDPPFYRLIGAVDGTQLTWTPSAPPGAPTSLSLGQVAQFSAPDAFVVRSQDSSHPFYAGQYMTGGAQFAGSTAGIGDPEWVTVIPPSQFMDYYAFFTDATYPETSIVVVRTRSKVDGSFADVTLDCTGPLTGWQPFGDYEYTQVRLVTGNFQSVDGCMNGRHEMSSTLPFGVTVWGWGTTSTTSLVSYAYPAGAGFQPINEVEIPTAPQ